MMIDGFGKGGKIIFGWEKDEWSKKKKTLKIWYSKFEFEKSFAKVNHNKQSFTW